MSPTRLEGDNEGGNMMRGWGAKPREAILAISFYININNSFHINNATLLHIMSNKCQITNAMSVTSFHFEIYAHIRVPNCTCIGYILHELLFKFILRILYMSCPETPTLPFDC